MKKFLWLVVAAFLVTPTAAFAGTIAMTGDLSDWGITEGADGTAVNWTSPMAEVISLVDPIRSPEGELGPGFGGAAFDAYAMYFSFDSQYAYFGIVTGFPQGGLADGSGLMPGGTLYPGDIALQFYGMSDPLTYQYGVRLNTTSNAYAGTGTTFGGVYKVSQWGDAYDGAWHGYDSANPVLIKSGTSIGTATVLYVDNTAPDPNGDPAVLPNSDPLYLYEAAVPLNLTDGSTPLNWAGGFTAHWTMGCGNDDLTMRNLTITPEPIGAALFLLGGLAFSTRRFLIKKKQ